MISVFDIAIVGGGAAGLAAAVSASEAGNELKIIVLEGNKKIGRKLLATGNGRCNLTNMNVSPEHYFGDTEYASKMISEFGADQAISFFEKIGLIVSPDSEGRVYPYNKQAAAVLEILRNAALGRGVEFVTEFKVSDINKSGRNYLIRSADGREITAQKVILSTGGMASPKLLCGTNGYELAESLGHKVTRLYPVLLQLTTNDKFLKNLSGMRCKADLTLLGDDSPVYSESGELLFADKAISGICVFGLSVYAGEFFATGKIKGKPYRSLSIKADLAPDISEEAIREYILRQVRVNPEAPAGEIITGIINMKVGREIVKRCGVDTLSPAKIIDVRKAEKIASEVKSLTLTVTGTKGWDDAQVTAGGIPLDEINLKTMESRKSRSVYLCGELLNIHGECGGYNLHWAWLTGIRAGNAAAKYLKGR